MNENENENDKSTNKFNEEEDDGSSFLEEEQNHDQASSITNDEIVDEETVVTAQQSTEYEEPTENTQTSMRQSQQKSNKSRSGLSALFGGLIGGIIAAGVVALLFVNNIIPINNETTNSAVETSSSPNFIERLSNDDEVHESTSIEEVADAVVGVVNLQQNNMWTGNEEAGTGSGIIYKKEGDKAYVVTNQHVVDGAENVEIVLQDDERVSAKVLGQDALTDLAILEVDGTNIDTVAKFGSSEDIAIGETVLAIGNPLGLEFANTVTKGIISGLNRSVEVDTNGDGQPDWVTEVIQTDAAINPGNSGGALINAQGEVIGINSMKIAQSAVEGIGFAIPVDAALPIMEQLETEGEITRPLIGISTAALYQVPPQYQSEINLPDDVNDGMVIANVEPGSPAEEAGLQQFDVITKINGQEITSILELRQFLYSETAIGEAIEIEYIRDGNIETTEIVLEQLEDAA